MANRFEMGLVQRAKAVVTRPFMEEIQAASTLPLMHETSALFIINRRGGVRNPRIAIESPDLSLLKVYRWKWSDSRFAVMAAKGAKITKITPFENDTSTRVWRGAAVDAAYANYDRATLILPSVQFAEVRKTSKLRVLGNARIVKAYDQAQISVGRGITGTGEFYGRSSGYIAKDAENIFAEGLRGDRRVKVDVRGNIGWLDARNASVQVAGDLNTVKIIHGAPEANVTVEVGGRVHRRINTADYTNVDIKRVIHTNHDWR